MALYSDVHIYMYLHFIKYCSELFSKTALVVAVNYWVGEATGYTTAVK